uniref:Uncharacterized protein n=1 Tax=Siphoviridae sp. ctqSm5 TaxID=2827949 RepID=A0A8S5SPA6_9CAUD|nr:MAG TPA: hypothetical protein [Siphoviridae sp. ctqSm5]
MSKLEVKRQVSLFCHAHAWDCSLVSSHDYRTKQYS